ncbi:MAG: heparinase II/III family protein [Dongiaceae bacterium]
MANLSPIISAPRRNWQRHWQKLLCATRLYNCRLQADIPEYLRFMPRHPWPGAISQGQALLVDELTLNGKTYALSPADWPSGENIGAVALNEWHRFGFLRDLHAHGGQAARNLARDSIKNWLKSYPRWHTQFWQPEMTADRVVAWLTHFAFFGASADDGFRQEFFKSLSRQLRHIELSLAQENHLLPRLKMIKALLHAALSLPESYINIEAVLADAKDILASLVLADGSCRGLNPSLQLTALQDCLEMRHVLISANCAVPEELSKSIALLGRALRAMRHGDGGLTLLRGAYEERAEFIDLLLQFANAKGRAPDFLPFAGLQRITAQRSLLLVDESETSTQPLAFEFSHGKERLIVSCGNGESISANWANATKLAAASSTLEIIGAAPLRSDTSLRIDSQRQTVDGNHLFEASHNGYEAEGFIKHQRRWYLNGDGDDLRGEDKLEGQGMREIALRFHLHPKVQATLTANSVLLKLPSQLGWRFKAQGGEIVLEDSVYLGSRGLMRRTQQIVLYAPVRGQGLSLQWALQREGKKE